jgi:glycosyltransferase involved in cell wall biosynthesis
MVAACPFPFPRGTPTRILRLAEVLGRRGHDVHVVTYHLGEPATGPFHVHRIRDVPQYTRTAAGPSARKLLQLDPLLASTLQEVVRRHAIEIIHAHHYEGLLTALWVRRRIHLPVLYDAHTLLASELPSYFPPVLGAFPRAVGALLDRRLPPLADAVAAVSEEIRSELLSTTRMRADAVSVVPSGVEADWFSMTPPRPANASERPKTLIFTGNLAAYQGIDLLLRSFRRVLDRRRDVRLQIVTGGSFEPYEALARALGVREFIEIIPDHGDTTPGYLSAADVALNPRVHSAGTPQKLLNYMAAGKPIVSFAGSAAILEHGLNGWLVPDDNDALFADGTLRCLEDDALARSLGSEAQRLAASYSWEGSAIALETIYDRLAGSCS